MTLQYFMKELKKKYKVAGIYTPCKDLVELWFYFEHGAVYLQYSGNTITSGTLKDALKRIEEDLKFYGEDK